MSSYVSRFLLFIHSSQHIYGCLFAVYGLGLYYFNIVFDNWYWIIIGLYAIGYRIAPKPVRLTEIQDTRLSRDELNIALNELTQKIENKVPTEVFNLTSEIVKILKDLLNRYSDYENDIKKSHLVHQTIVDYLPNTLDKYLSIPKVYSKLYKMKDGSTADEMVFDQLSLLKQELYRVTLLIAEKKVSELSSHEKFLNQKFNKNIEDWIG